MIKILRSTLLILLCGSLPLQLSAQNISINLAGNTGSAAAILDLSDASNSSLGLLMTKVTLTSASLSSPITSPPAGLIVYNTATSTSNGLFGTGFYYWSGSQWIYMINSGNTLGTVTSIGLTGPGGIFGITNTNGNPITSSGSFGVTTSGTSGGIPYFSSSSVLSSSALLTQYGILYGGGSGGAPVSTAALANGQVLIGATGAAPVPATITPVSNSGISITNGAGSISIGTNGALNTITVLTSASTSPYAPSAGTKTIQVELIGGGGGGGSTSAPGSAGAGGGGGGSGGYVKFYISNVSGTYAFTIGAGGTGATAGNNGSSGTATTFVGGYSAGGGSGGLKGTANVAGAGGAGGSASGGLINIPGTPGGNGPPGLSSGGAVSGAGGSSVLGGGGAPTSTTTSATSIVGNTGAANSGGGGSGSICYAGGTAVAGGAGANGIIIITEYK